MWISCSIIGKEVKRSLFVLGGRRLVVIVGMNSIYEDKIVVPYGLHYLNS